MLTLKLFTLSAAMAFACAGAILGPGDAGVMMLTLRDSTAAGPMLVQVAVEVERFTPPPSFERVYHEVEACSGRRGEFAQVEWYWMPGPIALASRQVTGFWKDRRIVMIRDDTSHVRHESLHDVLYVSGWRPVAGARTYEDGHPHPPFGWCAPG